MTIQYPAVYQQAFCELRERCNHTIRVFPADKNWLTTFNCYAFALGIARNARYQALVQTHRSSVLADSSFMSMLLEESELAETHLTEAKVGDLVLYIADGRLRHAGVITTRDHRVVSKWGPNELYDHGLFEVPEGYGEPSRFTRAPNPRRVISLLEKHITECK